MSLSDRNTYFTNPTFAVPAGRQDFYFKVALPKSKKIENHHGERQLREKRKGQGASFSFCPILSISTNFFNGANNHLEGFLG